jgi:hypothetical protein
MSSRTAPLLGNTIAGAIAIVASFVIEAVASLLMLCTVVVAVALFFGERTATMGHPRRCSLSPAPLP